MARRIDLRGRPEMAFRSRTLDPIREILDSAERLDLTLSGGAILHDEELDLYVESLLQEIKEGLQGRVSVVHHERTATGVILTVVPVAKTTAVFLFCKQQACLVDRVDYDYKTEKITVGFGVRPPVRFCTTVAWCIFLYAVAGLCLYYAVQSTPPGELWQAFF